MGRGPEPWTPHDSALHETCTIATAVAQGRADHLHAIPHTFAADLAPDDRVLATGGYALLWWGQAGDGSYSTSGFMAMGTGKLGLGLLAASAVGSSVGNARARRRAAEAATPMWRPVDQGGVHVSLHGFYLTDGHHGFRRFGWHHIVQASVVEPGCLHYHATTDEGPADFLLRSDWAELAFVLWALARNPHHPQLLGRTWIDPAFPARCERHGYAPPTLQLG